MFENFVANNEAGNSSKDELIRRIDFIGVQCAFALRWKARTSYDQMPIYEMFSLKIASFRGGFTHNSNHFTAYSSF